MTLKQEVRESIAQAVLPNYIELHPTTIKRVDQATEAILAAVLARLPKERVVKHGGSAAEMTAELFGRQQAIVEFKSALEGK
jgi:hypothetical protein